MAESTFKERAGGAFRDLTSPEGLATGALGAFLFGGPVGIALGLAQGILARRTRESELDAQAKEQDMLSQLDALQAESIKQVGGLASTDLDRAQLAQVARDYQMLRRQSMSPDADTRQAAIAKLADFGPNIGAWLEDLEGRNETQLDKNVSILDEQAATIRTNYQDALDKAQDVQRISSEMHQLLSDPNFDVNSMLNRARLGDLMGQTPRNLFADPVDMADALKETGAALGGIPGAITSWIAGKKKAADFEWTREDWRKVAYAMQLASKRQTDRQLEDAMSAGKMLDETAGRIGHVPALTYLDRIVTGKVQGGASLAGESSILGDIAAEKAAKERADQAARAAAAKENQGSAGERVKSMLEKTADVAEGALKSTVRETLDFIVIRIRDKAEGGEQQKKKRRPTNGSTGAW
jgi:hypothetical protein